MPSWAPGDSGGGGAGGGSAGGSSGGGGSGNGSGARGGGAAAAMPGGGGAGRGGGIALDFRRGKTSQELLTIDWGYPVWKPKEQPAAAGQQTVSGQREYALPLAEAYELVTSGDRRPLLVLRECERCKGTDHALLSQSLDNEQTVLLTRWFKCVKLPPNVLDEAHPFHNLFRREQEGERIPHLYFCSHDGSNKQALPGDQSQAQLWETMYSILEREYEGNAKKRVKELRALLSQFDSVDSLAKELKARMDREFDKRGPDSPKLKAMQKDLDELGERRKKLLAEEQKLREMPLVEPPPAAEADAGK